MVDKGRPLRILIVHNRYQIRGGEESVVDAEVALLRDHGHEVWYVFSPPALTTSSSR